MDDLRKLAEAATPTTGWHLLKMGNSTDVRAKHQVGGSTWVCECRTDEVAAYIAACSPDRILKLLDALEFAAKHCPCGARPESPNSHPHVTGCPIGAALSGAGTRTASDE